MALRLKKGDTVKVLAGKDKGKTGVVLSSNPKKNTVVVDGVNVITKHVKPRSAQEQGGIKTENGNINVSNVMVVCPVCGKATKIAAGEENGKKVRICKHCKANLDAVKKEEVKPVKKTVRKKSAKATEATAEETAEAPVKKTVRKKSAKTAVATEEVAPVVESAEAVEEPAKESDETSNA